MTINENLIDESNVPTIKKFAYLGGDTFNEHLNILSEMAETEKWNTLKNKHENDILYNYIINVFDRIYFEDKITNSEDKNYCIFNTGLLTNNGDEIYGCFELSKLYQQNNNLCKWFFKGFYEESNRFIMSNFSDYPNLASFFDDYSELYFDPKIDLKLNWDHILDDRWKERVPENIAKLDKESVKILLNGSLEVVIKKIKRNSRIPIPIFYKGEICFLIPLKIGDLIVPLAVEKLSTKLYRGNTILSKDIAYTDARLIMKLDVNWLIEK